MSVMVLQGRKSYPQKSRPPESGHRRHGVWIAIEYSYKLGQKKEFKFLCVTGWFSRIRSHKVIVYSIVYSLCQFKVFKASFDYTKNSTTGYNNNVDVYVQNTESVIQA